MNAQAIDLGIHQWRYLPLTRTPRKPLTRRFVESSRATASLRKGSRLLTCCCATLWRSPAQRVSPDQPRRVYGACSIALPNVRHRRADHRLPRRCHRRLPRRCPRLKSLECQAPPAHRRCPPDATHSTSDEGNAGHDASISAHVRRSPHTQRQERTFRCVLSREADSQALPLRTLRGAVGRAPRDQGRASAGPASLCWRRSRDRWDRGAVDSRERRAGCIRSPAARARRLPRAGFRDVGEEAFQRVRLDDDPTGALFEVWHAMHGHGSDSRLRPWSARRPRGPARLSEVARCISPTC